MKVQELIDELSKITNKDLPVVMENFYYANDLVDDVVETDAYFGLMENGGYVCKIRKCVKIV